MSSSKEYREVSNPGVSPKKERKTFGLKEMLALYPSG